MTMGNVELGFVGAGNMATALCRGIVGAGLVPAKAIIASDPDAERRRAFEEATGAATTADNADVCSARTIVLAVKPQVMPTALDEIGPLLQSESLIISIAAGVSIAQIEAASEKALHVIRTMPNTPMLVGAGAAALCAGTHATDEDMVQARRLFESCATVIEVDEPLIHAVTAVSGSGPAYVFYLTEIMVAAAEQLGLAREDAVALVDQTILGAGRMLAETTDDAAELRRKVTSPGGTTEAALTSMQSNGVAETLTAAIEAACARSKELGQPKD
jgi:pyrroline-5-carboxylate reductase